MAWEGLSRRGFLVGAVVGLSAPSAAAQESEQPSPNAVFPPDGNGVGGVIIDIADTNAFTLRRWDTDESLSVRMQAEAWVWKQRRADLSAFMPGEEVVVEGQYRGNVFLALALTNTFRPIEGRIRELTSDQIETTGGTAQLISDTTIQDGESIRVFELADLAVGQQVGLLARLDPSTNGLVAVRIYPYETASAL